MGGTLFDLVKYHNKHLLALSKFKRVSNNKKNAVGKHTYPFFLKKWVLDFFFVAFHLSKTNLMTQRCEVI